MSKVIVRIEMPRNCLFCPMSHWNKIDKLTGCDAVDGKQHVPKEDEFWKTDRPSWCPIKGVLPDDHGDLIDRDALIETCQKLFDKREKEQIFTGSRGPCVTWNDAIYHIISAPTVYSLSVDDNVKACDEV